MTPFDSGAGLDGSGFRFFDGKLRTIAQAAFAADRTMAAVIMLAGALHHGLAIHPSDVRVKSNHAFTVAFLARRIHEEKK
jgi:hypothetical protein